MNKRVSVVILNWNGKEHLRRCLTSFNQVIHKPLEIIVVDNNSNDASVHMVRRDFPHIKLLALSKNQGYSGGNNRGIEKSTGDYVLILNNDTEVTHDFLKPLVARMESDKTIACVQPKLLYASDHSLLNAVGSYLTSTGFLYHYGYRKKSNLPQYNKALYMYSAKGAAMLFRKSALDTAGLFDEDFFIYFEETDLCHRLWLSGYTVVYEPESIVYHHEAVDTKRQFTAYRTTYLSFRNRIYSFLKNLEPLNAASVIVSLFMIYSVLIVYYLIVLQPGQSIAIIAGIVWNIKKLPTILSKRRVVQRLRKKTDKQLFLHIKKNPPVKYYYYLFTTLKNFTNEKPVDEAKYL